MTITFLVGNGFDISCGINTSYSDFCKWYVKQPSTTEKIANFKDTINKDISQNIPNELKTWADFEIGLGKYTENFSKETASDFLDCHEDAHEKIIEYISEQINMHVSPKEISDEQKNALSTGIAGFYQELSSCEKRDFGNIFSSDRANNTMINFVSFNYTYTLDETISMLSVQPIKQWEYSGGKRTMSIAKSVVHPHGTLDNNPILGVDNESQFANKELVSVPQFKDIMVKNSTVNALGELWHEETEKLIQNSSIICIWGMSIGDSDTRWWKLIMEWLRKSGDRHVIIFWHTAKVINSSSPSKQIKEKAHVLNKILKFAKATDDEIGNMRRRIHVVFNSTKVLKVKLNEKKTHTIKLNVDEETAEKLQDMSKIFASL